MSGGEDALNAALGGFVVGTRAPRVRLSPTGRAAVRVSDPSMAAGDCRWIEVWFDYDAGGLNIKAHEDDEVAGWPEYGAPG